MSYSSGPSRRANSRLIEVIRMRKLQSPNESPKPRDTLHRESAGYQLKLVEPREQFVRCLDCIDSDLILTDYKLPDRDGTPVLERDLGDDAVEGTRSRWLWLTRQRR